MDTKYRDHLVQTGEWSRYWGQRWHRRDFAAFALILGIGGLMMGVLQGSWFAGVATMLGLLIGAVLVRLLRVRVWREK